MPEGASDPNGLAYAMRRLAEIRDVAAPLVRCPEVAERMERIIAVSEEIPLASDKDFNQFYMDSMFFEV